MKTMSETETIPDLHPIFASCCAKEDGRYKISKPFARGGFVYATDGRRAVRQPYEGPDFGDGPDVGQVFVGEWETRPTPLPNAPPEWGPHICPECDRVPSKPCAECCGSGETECCECGADRECPDCDGKGKNPCEDCDGAGTVEGDITVFVLDGERYGIRRLYIYWLRSFGITEVYLPKDRSQGNYDHHCKNPLRFVLGDIEGLVLPCRVEKSE